MQPDSSTDQAGRPPKVAIPRLGRHGPPPPGNEKKDEKMRENRVGKACTNCRKRKVKCSGELPQCNNCKTNSLECWYEQARRDRLKSTTLRNQSLVALLRDLSLRVGEEDKRTIQNTLAGIEDDTPAPPPPLKTTKRRRQSSSGNQDSDDASDDFHGEATAPASVGSNEDLDLLDENLLLNRASRETGFVGQNSEIQWLRTLQRDLETVEGEPSGQPYGPPGGSRGAVLQRSDALHERRKSGRYIEPVEKSSFYLDKDSLELDDMVDPFDIPGPEQAERLFDCYWRKVHSTFPILAQNFPIQFRKYYESVRHGRPYPADTMWLAALNLVFAVGARYIQLAEEERRGDSNDHIVYMTRSVRLLGFNNNLIVVSAPSVTLIQTTGLLSFYYLAIGHVSRAWIMIGISIRLALALGLHLRNEDMSTSADRKETLLRVWWSLHSIECVISAITGRPCVIGHEDCTVALPHVYAEEQSRVGAQGGNVPVQSDHRSTTEKSSSVGGLSPEKIATSPLSYLDAHVNVGLITQKVLAELYSPRTANRSWQYIQKRIRELTKELEEWRRNALPENASGPLNTFLSSKEPRDTTLLKFSYYSTKILITRPCLCRTERRIKRQSERSADFNQQTAETCVQAAQALTQLFPDQPEPHSMYENGPWWSLVHNMMQAMAVLLLELSYQATHMTTNGSEITVCVKKLMRWLDAMRRSDEVPRKAYTLVMDIVEQCKRQLPAHAAELLSQNEPAMQDSTIFESQSQSKSPSQRESRSESQNQSRSQSYAYSPEEGSQETPSQWYGGYYPTTQPGQVDISAGSGDPQLPARQQHQYQFHDFHHQQASWLHPQQQMSPPEQPYSFVWPELLQNPSAYSNPFVNAFDQDVPISFSMNNLWQTAATTTAGPSVSQAQAQAPAQSQAFEYQPHNQTQ